MATSRSRAVTDGYHFTVVYDGCLSGEDKTDSIKLSYAFVEILQGKARKQGIDCFLPHLMIKGGQIELKEIFSAVKNSEHVILVMTEGYLEKMCGKKLPDSQNDPDSMLQLIHYNIIDYKISKNTDGIIVVPIYLQTRQKEISLGAYRSIQFRKKEDWEDEENWEKIWDLIPKDLQPSVLIGSAVSSQGSSAGESDARLSVEEMAGSSTATADSKTDARQRSESTAGSPPCVNMDSSPNGARNLQPSVLTVCAVSSQGSSEPDAGESAQSDSNQGVIFQETAAAVGETATDAVSSMTENFSKMSSSETAENPQESTQVESLTSDARLSVEGTAGSSTADSKTYAHQRSESTEDDSTAIRLHSAGSPPCVNMDSSPSGARRTKSSDEKTENEGAAIEISRSQSEPACIQQQQEKKSIAEKVSDWFSLKFSRKQ